MHRYKTPYREVSNPADFKAQFLTDPSHSFCEACHDIPHVDKNSFLEIATLEHIKSLHKDHTFQSTRRKFYTVILLTAGTITETIGHQTYSFHPDTLYFIPENQLHTIHHWSNDVKGFHCIFDADYFLLCLKNQVRLNEYPFFQPGKNPFIKLSPAQTGQITELFRKISTEYCNRRTYNDDLLVRLYLNVLLIETERCHRTQHNNTDPNLSRKEQLVAQFKLLVSNHFIRDKQVSDYAKRLYVNAHYLNDIVKDITGRPASSFIHTQVMLEAKARLVQSNDTIASIALALNFSDLSYFCRFFKKQAGVTPIQYRNKHPHNN